MSTPFYDLASLVVVPSGYKASKVYAQKPLTTDGQLAFTRSTGATRVASNGLIEKVRTNVLLQSNQFNTTWALSSATIASGQSGYDGTNNAWLLSKTGDFGRVEQSTSVTGLYAISVYAKAGTLNFLSFELSGIVSDTTFFNLQNGVVGIKGANALFSSIESAGNGWYRCSAVFNGTLGIVRIQPSVADGTVNGSNGNILIQAAQLEVGDIATDYIATTTAAVSVGPVSGLPRLDYLNSSCPRLLLEPQRTNLVTFSENFDNAAWTKAGASITSNTTTSPDGYANADKLGGSVGTADQVYVGQSLSLPSAGTYTYSFFAKASDKSWVRLRTLGFDAGGNVQTWFNLADGTIGTDGSGNAKIVSYGNGWYRCSYSFTTTTDLIGSVYAYLADANNGLAVTRDGTGVFLWGAMLELGAYATSYIPTLSTSVTRVADAASKTGISSLIGQTEGTLFIEAASIANDGTFKQIALDDGTTNNLLTFNFSSTTNGLRVFVRDAGTAYSMSATVSDVTQFNKYAVKYKDNDFALWANGVELATSIIATVPNSLSNLKFNNGSGGGLLYGNIKQFILIPTALSDSDLATLTSL